MPKSPNRSDISAHQPGTRGYDMPPEELSAPQMGSGSVVSMYTDSLMEKTHAIEQRMRSAFAFLDSHNDSDAQTADYSQMNRASDRINVLTMQALDCRKRYIKFLKFDIHYEAN